MQKTIINNIKESFNNYPIEKSKSGTYKDTPLNRKFGRVGQKFGEKTEVITSEKLHKLAKTSGLKGDLDMAYDTRKKGNIRVASDWIYSIDPGHMDFLKDLWVNHVDGNYSLSSLANAIVGNKKIKMK